MCLPHIIRGILCGACTRILKILYEAERHRPAPRLWASFSRAAPRVQLLRQYQDKYAIFHLELENYGPSPTNFH